MNATLQSPVSTLQVLGLFPAWDPGPIGGIQRSGREAWDAVVARTGVDSAQVICYPPGASKARTVMNAMRVKQAPQTVLVWHLDLLKLLPFLNLANARVALFLHGVEAWRSHDWVTQRLFRRVHLFLSNTDHTWETFLEYYPHAAGVPHVTTHLGLDAPLSGPSPAPGPVPAALMLSRLDANQNYKGQQQMIAAWPRVLEQIPDAELWIAGGGDLRSELEMMVAALKLGSRVRFFGEISDTEKQRLLSDCTCFAMPSRGDGFGLVYLEAMRAGRPCLVSTIDSGREVVNPPEAGLAVDPEVASDVAAATVRLLSRDGDEWRRWSTQARARYETRFTVQLFRERLQQAIFNVPATQS